MDTLQDILELIDSDNHEELEKILDVDNSQVNTYHEMEVSGLRAKLTPLHRAVKKMSVPCVKVLIKYGADPSKKLITGDGKTLQITVTKLAEGEKDMAKKRNDEKTVAVYEEILESLNNINSKKAPSTPSSASSTASSTSEPKQTTVTSPIIDTSGVTSVDIHKIFLRANQNQIALRKLTSENEKLKEEIESLKKDIVMLQRLLAVKSPAPSRDKKPKKKESSAKDSPRKSTEEVEENHKESSKEKSEKSSSKKTSSSDKKEHKDATVSPRSKKTSDEKSPRDTSSTTTSKPSSSSSSKTKDKATTTSSDKPLDNPSDKHSDKSSSTTKDSSTPRSSTKKTDTPTKRAANSKRKERPKSMMISPGKSDDFDPPKSSSKSKKLD
eukprot:TRINITY_DN842_c0_g1_i2.p1 TRINITY_DN842_c0_g1~~TRINITY_DN842_c0_g1_i2.p1  ORF type:complete len:383 (+),score=158.95 TRINITY_DN842_c0_g1_i2:48-1196(+)